MWARMVWCLTFNKRIQTHADTRKCHSQCTSVMLVQADLTFPVLLHQRDIKYFHHCLQVFLVQAEEERKKPLGEFLLKCKQNKNTSHKITK